MSLKAVELQVAIPRVQDAAKIQDQLQQRPHQDQQHVSLQFNEEQKANRKKTTSSDAANKGEIRDQESSREQQMSKQQKHNKKQKKNREQTHPYKGHNLDISL